MKIAALVMALGSVLLLLSFAQGGKSDGVRMMSREMGETKDASAPYAGAAYPNSHGGSGEGLGDVDDGSGPDPHLVILEEIKYAGSGCGHGSVRGELSQDARSLTPFSGDSPVAKVVAKSGPGVSLAESRKNCHYSVTLMHPVGWSYALVAAEFEGSVDLDSGATGIQDSYYYFQGVGPQSAVLPYSIDGPKTERFVTGNLTYEDTVWSPCANERYLQINVAARMKGRGVRGTISLENQKFFLKWRKCTGAETS